MLEGAVLPGVAQVVGAEVDLLQAGHPGQQRQHRRPVDVVAVEHKLLELQGSVVQLLVDLVVVVVERLVEQVVGQIEKDEVLEVGKDLSDVGPVGEKVIGEIELRDVLDPAAEIFEVAEPLNVVVVQGDDVGQHAVLDLGGAGDEDDEAEVLLVVLLLLHVLGLYALPESHHVGHHPHPSFKGGAGLTKL